MSTFWSEVITESAMQIIDDIRWRKELSANPARFFRAKSLYVSLALPLLSRPPQLLVYLQNGMVAPSYADAEWKSTQESTGEQTIVQTENIGYELFSCVIRAQDSAGGVALIPYPDAVYDAETGNVTFPQQRKSGVTYEMDFYTDGEFPDMTISQKRLMGLAIACVWDERFERNWLNIQPKIKDASFATINEANFIEKSSARKLANRSMLNDELRKYEQDSEYATVIGFNGQQHMV